MGFEFKGKEIKFDKELNLLDKFVLDFVKILEKHTKYVIISGYVSILFGRSRATEDIDLFIEKLTRPEFDRLAGDLIKAGYWLVNSANLDELYDMLKSKLAIRVTKDKTAIPNFEIKFPEGELDKYSFDNRIKVILNGITLYVSPIEMQIAYKLKLGSNKDFEDAKHLFELFKEHLDKEKLNYFIDVLNVRQKAEENLWKKNPIQFFKRKS